MSFIRRTKIIYVICLVLALLAPAPPAYAKKSNATKTATAKKTSTSKKSSSAKSSVSKSSKKSSGKKSTAKQSETAADVKKRQEAAQQEIKQTQEQIRQNEAEIKKNLSELGKLETDIASGKEKVAEAQGKVNVLHKQISGLQAKIAAEQAKLEKLRAEYLKAVKKMRAKRKEQSKLAFVFSSSSFNQAIRRMRYLKEVSAWREKQTAEINGYVASLKKETQLLENAKAQHEKALAESVKAQNELQAQYTRQDAIVVNLKSNGAALKSHLQKKQAEVNALKNRVAALIAEEQRKAEAERAAREKALAEEQARKERELARQEQEKARKEQELAQKDKEKEKTKEKTKEKQKEKTSDKAKEKSSGQQETGTSYAEARGRRPRSSGSAQGTAAPTVSSSSFEGMKGSLPRPVSGSFRVTSRFGPHSLPDMPDVVYDNPGIDAEVSKGASALAVYAGKVSGVYMLPGYSTVVIVSHDGYYTVYGNIASASVKAGDSVKQGQALGSLAPDEDDPSVSMIHFEVWKNRDKQDPLNWIR